MMKGPCKTCTFPLDEKLCVNHDSGDTPLMFSAHLGHKQCMKAWIQAEADVNEQNEEGLTALICAAVMGRDKCLDLLLNAGADVNSVDNLGYIALIYTAAKGHDKCVKRLIKAGADVNMSSYDGNCIASCFSE